MIFSWGLLGKGMALGAGAAVPIGPVNVEIARRTLRRGFLAGFALGCGAVTIDVTYAILSSLSLGELLNRPAIILPVTVAGTIFLLYLSFLCFRGAFKAARADPLEQEQPRQSHHGAYFTGLAMTLLNPMTLGFWFLAVPAALGAIAAHSAHDLPIVCTGVFLATLAWVMLFAGTLTFVGRWRKKGWLAAADAVGGAVLFCFAALELWHTLRPHL